MKTPSPISKVSRCLKPTPLPICSPIPHLRATGPEDRAPHQRVDRPVAVREAAVELDEAADAVRRAQVLREPDLGIGIGADVLAAVHRAGRCGCRFSDQATCGLPDDRRHDLVDLRRRHLREHRQRQHFVRGRFGLREVARAVAEIGVRRLQVHRDRIVQAGLDALLAQGVLQVVAVGRADGVDVIDVAAVGDLGRQPRRHDVRFERARVSRGARCAAPRSTPSRWRSLTRRTAPWMPSMR